MEIFCCVSFQNSVYLSFLGMYELHMKKKKVQVWVEIRGLLWSSFPMSEDLNQKSES